MNPPRPDPAGQGEESVWAYPRPPRLERVNKRIEIVLGSQKIVDAAWGFRVLETSHPPVYYISPDSVGTGVLSPAGGSSYCEWKGQAVYFDVRGGDTILPRAAWAYPDPTGSFAAIAGFVAFYAGPMDACRVGGALVTPQPGHFYGGWITPEIKGPFKGSPGSTGW